MKKRITVLTQYYKPEIGAPQNRLLEMITGLKKHGWEVSVITAMPNYPQGKIFNNYRRKLFYINKVDDVDVFRTWLYASNSSYAIPRIFSMLSFSFMAMSSLIFLLKKKPDILLVESPPLTLGVTGVILSKLVGAKFVFNVSDLWPLTAKELGAISDGVFYKFLELIERFLYKNASVCLGQSAEIVDYIKKHGANKVYLFRNGVAPERFKNIITLEKKPRTLVYAGLLGVAQGLLKICKKLDFKSLEVDFHIYGDGREKVEICQYLNDNPDKGIFYHGSVSRSEIPSVLKLYSASLIVLVKNIYGAVPSKIYESMAAGLPIFFSGAGEAVSIINENNLGWCSKPNHFSELENNIKNAFNDNIEFEKKINNCILISKHKFNRTEQIEELSIYLSNKI